MRLVGARSHPLVLTSQADAETVALEDAASIPSVTPVGSNSAPYFLQFLRKTFFVGTYRICTAFFVSPLLYRK